MKPACLKTRFMVPAWWEKSYEAAVAASAQNVDSLTLSTKAMMTPALQISELDALTIILSCLQEQLLDNKPLQLDPEEHRKNISSNSRTRVVSFERVFQGISGLKLLSPNGHAGYAVTPVFKQERWLPNSNGTILIELEPSSVGREVVLGYGEPYVDLLRRVCDEADVQTLLGQKPPLALWQSTWLDLSGPEQATLLRLERAMQWEFRWLTIDGVFGMPMQQLFAGIDIPRPRKSSSQMSPLVQKQRFLERLGKKLVDHGMLHSELGHDYLALAPEEIRGAWLVWQVARDRLFPEESKEYLQLAARHLFHHVYQPRLSDVLKVMAGNLYDSAMDKQFRTGMEGILAATGEEIAVVTRLNENLPLNAIALFCEWNLRQMAGHERPLPSELSQSAAAQAAHPGGKDEFVARFERFVSLIQDTQYQDDLKKIPGATLTSEVTWQEKAYRRYLMNTRRHLSESLIVPKAVASEPVVPSPVPEVPETSFSSSSIRPSEVSLGKMKKIATEELILMREKDKTRYEFLKKTFLEQLDGKTKEDVRMLQNVMTPDLFDKQIQNKIVKFMVENPGAWRSGSVTPSIVTKH